MMEWLHYKDKHPPIDGSQFLIYWDGNFIVVKYHMSANNNYGDIFEASIDDPGYYIEIGRDFNYWMPIPLPPGKISKS
jgi:hypothetical protein